MKSILKPILKGTLKENVDLLMSKPVKSQSRQKAILTISHTRNVNRDDAKYINSLAIAKEKK